MNVLRARNGYTFLLSVLFIGAIATAVTGSMLLLSWLSLRNAQILEQSGKAFAYATTCAEHALSELKINVDYTGNEEVPTADGTCVVLTIGGSGNENRTICTEGTTGGTTRRLEIIISRILPSIQVFSWREVEYFTSCSYE